MPEYPADHPVERFLVDRFAPEPATNGPCPEPGLLAGYAEGRLLPEEREVVESHVAECEDCRVLAAAIAGGRRDDAPAARTWRWYAAVAAVAAAILLAIVWGGRGGETPPRDTETLLFAAAADLAKDHAELFGEFTPLTKDERRQRKSVERGALVALYPAGLVVETRPRLRWEPAPGVERYSVSMFASDGGTIWTRTTNDAECVMPADQPALKPGKYVWEVSYTGGPFGGDSARRTFTVATREQSSAFERGLRRIDSDAPADIAELLKAHFAIRENFYGEAERAARAFLTAHPDDPVARETLFQALELLGSSEAGQVLEGD